MHVDPPWGTAKTLLAQNPAQEAGRPPGLAENRALEPSLDSLVSERNTVQNGSLPMALLKTRVGFGARTDCAELEPL